MLSSQRALFDIPREVCYLNAASWSPLPLATQEAGRAGVARKGRPWTIEPNFPGQQYDRARRAAARLINADPNDVALIPSVSYGVASAAKVLGFASAVATGSNNARSTRSVSGTGVIKTLRPGSLTVHSAFDVTCKITNGGVRT